MIDPPVRLRVYNAKIYRGLSRRRCDWSPVCRCFVAIPRELI